MSDNIVALCPNVNFRDPAAPINESATTEPVVAAPAGSDVKDCRDIGLDGYNNPHAVAVLPDADFKARLEALAREIEHFERTAIFRIALRLDAAHELFRYRRDEGGFQGWAENRLGYSRSHAYRLLDVANLAKVSQSWNTFGSLPVSAIYLLAAPSTPEIARNEVLDRLKDGDHVSYVEVNRIVTDAKLKPGDGELDANNGEPDREHNQTRPPAEHSANPDEDHHPAEGRAGGGERHNDEIVKKPRRAAARAPTGSDRQHDDQGRGGDERHDDPVDRVALFLDLWSEATSDERVSIRNLVLKQYLTTASGEDLHNRIPAARRKQVIGALLDRLSVDGLRKVMSPEFDAQLRAAMPHIKRFKTEHAVQTGTDASGKPIFALQGRGGRSRPH